jgi:3-oxoacyl-[acyl-carrier protein] reductase
MTEGRTAIVTGANHGIGAATALAAKAAQVNYTMSATLEPAHQGITANMVYPPVTDTGWVTDAVRDVVRSSPTHIHVASPEEVAEVIATLPPTPRR